MLITNLASFIKETFIGAFKALTSKERLKSLYGVSLYRNAVYLMLNSVAVAVTGFVFWMLAARLYSTEAVGLGSATIAAASLLALLSTLGLDYGLIRFLPGSGEKSSALLNSCFTISGLVSIVVALIFLAGLGVWSPALLPIREHPIFFITFVIFTASATVNNLANRSFIAERKAGFALAQSLIGSLLRFIPLVVLAAFFHTFGIFASWGLGALIALPVGVFLFLPRVQAGYHPFLAIRKKVISEMAHFSSLNYIAALLWSAPALVLPLMVVNLLGAEANAYFYIGWSIGGILSLVPMAISFSLFAEGSHSEEKLKQEVKRSLRLILLILIPAIPIILLLGGKILLLFGKTYAENATKLLWIVALSALPLSLNYIYFSIKRVEMKLKGVVGLSGFIAIATLALAYVLLPQIGILGAGVAWLVSQGIAALWVTYKLRRGAFLQIYL